VHLARLLSVAHQVACVETLAGLKGTTVSVTRATFSAKRRLDRAAVRQGPSRTAQPGQHGALP
jgi:hypothetical protein